MNLGIKVTGISLRGINVPEMIRKINEGSDVYSEGNPLQIGEIYQHVRPCHWAWQGLNRKVFRKEALAHVSGRFDVYRALEEGREVVARARFESQEFCRGRGELETVDSLVLNLLAPLYAGVTNLNPEGIKNNNTIMPGQIIIRTATDNSNGTGVLEYTYSSAKGGSLIGGRPVWELIPQRMFVA